MRLPDDFPIEYYYCEDYNSYVKNDNGIFYSIKNGKEILNDFYDKILIGGIFYDDITKEEYEAQLY